ncbi:hypothetical protein [Photobacterium sanguinicancri]|nr:hypothetical protein [Photobacterium sanguinicancri]
MKFTHMKKASILALSTLLLTACGGDSNPAGTPYSSLVPKR